MHLTRIELERVRRKKKGSSLVMKISSCLLLSFFLFLTLPPFSSNTSGIGVADPLGVVFTDFSFKTLD